MTDSPLDDTPQEDVQLPDELSMLKERANTMGLRYSPNIGVDTLRSKIEDHMTSPEKEITQSTKAAEPDDMSPLQRASYDKQQLRSKLIKEQTCLVRCRIVNMNPAKRDLEGEIFTVANRYIGSRRKFIPYATEASANGFHMEKIIFDDLKARKFQMIKTNKVNGQIVVDTKMVSEFNLEVMPPLTEEEIAQLAATQGAAQRAGA